MKSKYEVLYPGTIVISTFIFLISCKKINEATTLGSNLIPVVDNITTFETTLDVDVYNDTFSLAPPNYDSLRLRGSSDTYFLGNITNDPLFGTSAATLFTQLKPSGFKFNFGFSNPDSLIGLDSVVLVLKYVNTFGDSTLPQSVNVFEVDPSGSNDFRYDTSYLLRENHISYTNLLGSATYTPLNLDDSVHLFEENESHQLRIRLDDAFGQRLLAYDTTSNAGNNAFYSDSAFNLLFKGFAVVPGGSGNALVGIDLSKSKLSIYYKYNHGVLDTTKKDFVFTTASASANYIQRDYSTSQMATHLDLTTPQDFAYIQTQPGTFARIKIHGLDTLTNKLIHRAELYVTEAYNDPLDDILTPPTYLYLDAFDTANNSVYHPIPYDIQLPDASSGSIIATNSGFGFGGKPALNPTGNTVKEWKFNISRYVQNTIKGIEPVYDLRLYAPYVARNTYRINGADYFRAFYLNPVVAAGRVRVYGGTPNTNPQRMRIRIIYSKI